MIKKLSTFRRSGAILLLLGALLLQSASLFIPHCLFAQGDLPETCSFCYCLADASCSSSDCTTSLQTNCATSTFTPPCTGSYTIHSYIECPSGHSCKNCWSCVNIWVNGTTQYIGNCHNACDNCSNTCAVNLTANVTYRIYVCKIPCTNHSCVDCDEDCRAIGCVYWNASDLCNAP